MEEGKKIQDAITEQLLVICQQRPAFIDSAKEVVTLIEEMREDDLDINKANLPEEEKNKTLHKIINTLKDNVVNNNISYSECYDVLVSISEMRQADFNYVSEFLGDLAKQYAEIAQSAKKAGEALEQASGDTQTVSKPSFFQVIKNIFKIRKSNEDEGSPKNKPK